MARKARTVAAVTVAAVAAVVCCFTLFQAKLWAQRTINHHSTVMTADAAESEYSCTGPVVFGPADDNSSPPLGGDVPPVRYVVDPYPTFNGVAVDGKDQRVVFSDENRKSVLVYGVNGTTGPHTTPPLHQILGPATGMGFVAGVAVDHSAHEVFVVNNDIEDTLVVFDQNADGNASPKRYLYVPHQSWGIALNPARDELAISVQQLGTIAFYRLQAHRLEAPLRIIKGPDTQLADPHGIYWDTVHHEVGVANHGNYAIIGAYGAYDAATHSGPPPGGHFFPPSITVYSDSAQGNAKPVRLISGSKTLLNWPMGVAVDNVHNEIAVANNGDNSILVFSRTANGNVAPLRVIAGARTGIDAPVGVSFDPQTNELWVANYGDHTALAFARNADGNSAPKRIIRNAPAGTPTVGFTNPYAIAVDSKRDEILVPN